MCSEPFLTLNAFAERWKNVFGIPDIYFLNWKITRCQGSVTIKLDFQLGEHFSWCSHKFNQYCANWSSLLLRSQEIFSVPFDLPSWTIFQINFRRTLESLVTSLYCLIIIDTFDISSNPCCEEIPSPSIQIKTVLEINFFLYWIFVAGICFQYCADVFKQPPSKCFR